MLNVFDNSLYHFNRLQKGRGSMVQHLYFYLSQNTSSLLNTLYIYIGHSNIRTCRQVQATVLFHILLLMQ